MTEEEMQARKDQLARGRETAKKNREEKQRALAEATRARLLAEQEAAMAGDDDEVEAEPEVPEVFEPPVVAVGGAPVVEEPGEPSESVELTPFDLFVQALDSETRDLLDEDELREIFVAQQAKARAEKKASAKKAAVERALQTARIAEGVLSPRSADEIAWRARMDEMVDFTVELPQLGGIMQDGNVGPVDIGLRIDQRIFLHGHRYPMTRAQYDSYRDIIYRSQQNELRFEGKGKSNWLARQALGSVERRIN